MLRCRQDSVADSFEVQPLQQQLDQRSDPSRLLKAGPVADKTDHGTLLASG
jgi:hypothetical protein